MEVFTFFRCADFNGQQVLDRQISKYILGVQLTAKPLVMQGISAVEELSLRSSVHKKETTKVAAW